MHDEPVEVLCKCGRQYRGLLDALGDLPDCPSCEGQTHVKSFERLDASRVCRACHGAPVYHEASLRYFERAYVGFTEYCAACEGSGVAPPLTVRQLRDALDAALLEGLSEHAPVVLVEEHADGKGCTTSELQAAVREGALSYGFHLYGGSK